MASTVWRIDALHPPRNQTIADRRLSQVGVPKPPVAATTEGELGLIGAGGGEEGVGEEEKVASRFRS